MNKKLGTYSRVRLAIDKKTKICYALKIFKKIVIVKENLAVHINKEIRVLRILDNPFMVFMVF